MHFLPNRNLTVLADGDDLESHAEVVSGVRGKSPVGGKATAYVCRKGNCELPATSPETFAEQIRTKEAFTRRGQADR